MFISFLGLGQGGSNIADEAASHGFYTSSINYSQGKKKFLKLNIFFRAIR